MLRRIVAWMRWQLAPKCPDCKGMGVKPLRGTSGYSVHIVCRLCRGLGRIVDDP